MSDYSFMRSGVAGTRNVNNNYYNEFNLKLTCMLRILMEKSVEMAGEYVEHSKRNTITCEDMIYSLQFEAHEFMSAENEEELANKVNDYVGREDTFQMFESIINSVSEKNNSPCASGVDEDSGSDASTLPDDCGSDADSESTFESEDEESDDEFEESTCECEMCTKMNKYHREWNDWNPTDELECMFKNAVDKAIDKMRDDTDNSK